MIGYSDENTMFSKRNLFAFSLVGRRILSGSSNKNCCCVVRSVQCLYKGVSSPCVTVVHSPPAEVAGSSLDEEHVVFISYKNFIYHIFEARS